MPECTPVFCRERLINREFRMTIFQAQESVGSAYLDVVVRPHEDECWYEVWSPGTETLTFEEFDEALAAFKGLL